MTTQAIYSNRKIHIALSLAFLYTILLVLNIDTVFWPFGRIDSPILLAQAILYSPLEYFTSPPAYQYLSYGNLTPWITLSWDIDYTLFQLEPLGYRVHQLLSAATLLGVVYLLLYRLTHSVLNTSIFCFAIITLPATFDVVDDLVHRHYLEGMVFCLLSFLFAEAYARKQAIIWLVFSVFLYGVSMSAKEIFIPLPGILFFLFTGSFKRKVVLIIPYAIILAAYMGWRFYMVGGGGGYSSSESLLSLANNSQLMLQVALGLAGSFFINASVTLLMLALFALLLFVNFSKLSFYTKAGLLVGILGVALPVLALFPIMSYGFYSGRWIFAPSVAFMIFFSYLCGITTSRKLSGIVYIVVFACSTGAAYFHMQKPAPLFIKGKGSVYTEILRSDPNSYVYTQDHTFLGRRMQAAWSHVAKLHNGDWGTLPIADLGQLRYHDTENKKAIVPSRKKPGVESSHSLSGENLDLLKDVSYNPQDGLITFSFAENLKDERCIVYLFGEQNGLLNKAVDCTQWVIPYRELKYLLRLAGYSLSDVSMAVWTEDPAGRFYSKPYKLDEVFDLDS